MTLERFRPRRIMAAGRRRLRGSREPSHPVVLSIVVPIYNAGTELTKCLKSLAAQTLRDTEIVLVDDGSTDGSGEIAQRFVDRHTNAHLIRRPHSGVGVARNAGVKHASGQFLAFCDADDLVPRPAYERLVKSLRSSGSDFAVGSVTLQRRGIYREPAWVRRSNARRRVGTTLVEFPEILANLMPGTRVFRRAFWDAQRLSFPEQDDHSDVVTMVQALLVADRFDVLPRIVYRWTWRQDGRSLFQRDLQERERVRGRMERIVEAGELLVDRAPEPVQRQFFAEILHTTTPDLIRASVCRDDGYWEVLSEQMKRLMTEIAPVTLDTVPVEDRIMAWLCAQGERSATEDFLEYAFDNQDGYPFREVDGKTHIALPFIDALASADADFTRVAESDLRYRTRLSELLWKSPGTLALEGAAFVEYVDDREQRGSVTLVLRDRRSGAEVTFPTRPTVSEPVNRWANRANEDHSRSAFAAEVDVSSLIQPEQDRAVFDVLVRLDLKGVVREAPFQSRRAVGSAGLLETSVLDGNAVIPKWGRPEGLTLTVRAAKDEDRAERAASPVVVENLRCSEENLELRGTATDDVELALVGPRTRTPWVPADRLAGSFTCCIALLLDEWGLGTTTLPTDDYAVVARLAGGAESRVTVHPDLWRRLPVRVDSGMFLLHPRVAEDGALTLRVSPGEFRDGAGAYARRRLRDETYPAAREQPLIDVVLFDTFDGRAAGDNPGPVCEELARRNTGLDLVFAVVDRSVVLPEGARPVIRWTREWYELLGRARYFVANSPLPMFFRKRPGQVLLHTWHGSPLKRIAHDRTFLDFPNWHHRRQLLVARRRWDLLLSQSPFCTRALSGAFLYEGEMLEIGYPRNDILSSPDAEAVRRRTREHFGLGEETRVILYAPTWRDNDRVGRVFNKVVYLDPATVVDQVPNSVVLVRGHYNTMKAAEEDSPDPRILDVTRYPDISHLYLASDALVTDYSSVFFDYVLTDRPMYFLAPDLAEYRDENRGFYLDYHETVPGPVSVTTEEIIAALNGPDEYAEVRRKFRAEFAPLDDGHASERAVDALLSKGETPTST